VEKLFTKWSKDKMSLTKINFSKQLFYKFKSLNLHENDEILKSKYVKIIGKCLICLKTTYQDFVWIKLPSFCTLIGKYGISSNPIIRKSGLEIWYSIMSNLIDHKLVIYCKFKKSKKEEVRNILSKVVDVIRSYLVFNYKNSWPIIFQYASSLFINLPIEGIDFIEELIQDLTVIREMNKIEYSNQLDQIFIVLLRKFGPHNICKIVPLKIVQNDDDFKEEEIMNLTRYWLINLMNGNCQNSTLRKFKLILISYDQKNL
jgi:hypothetical protein